MKNKNEILKMQLKYSSLTQVSNLKIKFNNIHGYFIEVTNKNSDKIIHSKEVKFYLVQNTVNNSRFQTNELRKASDQILSAEEDAIILEKKLYREICNLFDSHTNNINLISKKISLIDVISNFANLAKIRNYVRPKIDSKAIIQIKNSRHPVVEESLTNESLEFNPNDCFMDEGTFTWLITGPNMAGKSTFLRQVAIIIILNQIGSYVPAESAKIGIFDKIFTRIGASDNLSKGMSTFMTEMVETSKIINQATPNSLVILDELGRGTSTEDGLAISQAVLEFILNEIRCFTLFATHYKQLCKLSENYKSLRLKTLQIKKWNEEIIFLHKVIDGISEGSFGIHVANLAGIKKPILERSKKILNSMDKKKFRSNHKFRKNELKDKSSFDDKNYINLKNAINEINPDNLSPKEALDFLYSLKKKFLDMERENSAFSSQVQKLKFSYIQRKKEIKNEFFLKNKALINCKNNSKNADKLIDELFKLANLKDKSLRDKISICAVGGYGREILAPFSDLDILFLHNNELNQKKLRNFIQTLLYPLWDLGLQVGYAVRNIEESRYYSNKDHVIQTSMLETRFICGNKNIFFRVVDEFKESIKKSGYKLIKDKIKERTKRVTEKGYDYFKNEPNLKETAGSLRDVNLIFWILNIYKIINSSTTNTPSDLLTKKEKRILNNSLEFLLLLRCHLHYQSGRMNDVLSFDYQLTISEKFFNFNSKNNFVDKNTFTEKMMKKYFIHIKNIKNFAEIFSQILDELFNKKLKKIKENIFIDDPNKFFSHYLYRIQSGKDDANDKRILLECIDKLDKSKILTKRNLLIIRKIFFSKNKEKFNLLYDLGILSKIVPEFSKISFLPQFDRFHSLTVGQHTLKAVNILKELDGKQIKKKV